MKARIGEDSITPAFKKLLANASEAVKLQIMKELGFDLANEQKRNIEAEKQYDGKPMKSPAKQTKFGGRFSKDYNWRYREGFRHMTGEEKKQFGATGKVGGGRGLKETKRGTKVRRRIPVTAASKQLKDTGATIKSIDILSVTCNRAAIGPKTGHGRKVLSAHEKTRKPFGISKEWADKARKFAFDRLLKGVGR